MDFDESSSSSSSGDELPIYETFGNGAQSGVGRFVDPVASMSSPESGGGEEATPAAVAEDYDEEFDDEEPLVDEGTDVVVESDGEKEDARMAEIPEWAQNLRRPDTSANVGKFSSRQDEFTRHLDFTADPDVEVSPQRSHRGEARPRPQYLADDEEFQVIDEDAESDNGSHFSEQMHNSAPRRDRPLSDDNNNDNEDDDSEAFPITEAAQWDAYLESGTLVDETPFTQVYTIIEKTNGGEEADDASNNSSESITQVFKLFSPPLPEVAIPTDFDRLRRLAERLCRTMLKNAEMIAGDDCLRDVMCNIEEVHCDSQTRIVVQEVSHLPCVSFNDIAAFSSVTSEHVRIMITTVVRNLVRLHERGLVHGSLHGGNILLNVESGSIKFTDGAGLLSCPVLAPDFGFISTHLASHIKDLLPTEVDPSTEPNSFLNELWTAFYEDPYQETFRDDAVSVAHLLAMLVNGFPSRFGMSLTEAIHDVDVHPTPTLLSIHSGGEFFAQRAAAAGFTEEFLHSAQSFVDVLVGTESLACEEVLEHPFVISSRQLDNDPSGDLALQLSEYLVQIGQEAQRSIDFSKTNAGSAPMNLRLFRNSIFAVNLRAAKGAAVVAEENTHVDLPEGVSFIGNEIVMVQGKGMQIVLVEPLPSCRTTLIIRNVENASIVILSKFTHIVLHDVCNSTVALGPCRVCVLEDIARCPRVAVAAVQAILSRVADVELALHSGDVPMCPDPSTISNVSIVPYGVSYPGLSFDFDAIGLPQESQASILAYQQVDAVERRTPQELFACTRTGHDYPYLRAMATMGKRLVHSNTLDDLYLFHDEVRDYKIVIQEVHGGPLSGSASHALVAPDSPSRSTRYVFPIIMIVDSVEDVYVSDCENVTIVVIGAKGAVNISNVRHAKLFVAGGYVMMSDCRHCEVHAFALKGAMIEDCERLVVFPMMASFPGIDEVIQRMAEANGLTTSVSAGDNLFLTPRVQVQNNQGVDVHQRPQLLVSLNAPELGACPSTMFDDTSAPSGVALMHVEFSSCVFEGHHLALDSGAVLERSSDMVVQLSNLIDGSILRTAGTLCPGRKASQPSDPATNLLISHIHTGVIHIADAVGHLTIVGCSGPLDIVVAAAQQVTVSECTGITVQVACFSFTAMHCRNCNLGLHVNTEPKLEGQCVNIQLSALNITCAGFEDVLDRASVQQHVNLYDHPSDADAATIGRSIASTNPYLMTKRAADSGDPIVDSGSAAAAHCASVDLLTAAISVADLRVSDVASARRLLQCVCFVSPPMSATCVGTAEAPFLEALEDRVEKDEKRPNVSLALYHALSTLAAAQLADMTDDSLLVGTNQRNRSPARGEDSIAQDREEQPPRPSARLAQRSRMGEHYDSSSDEEDDDDPEESNASSADVSPHKKEQCPPQTQVEASPSNNVQASQPVGSMMAGGFDDDTTSSSGRGTPPNDADDDPSDQMSSEDDDEYSHRGAGNALSPQRHEHATESIGYGDLAPSADVDDEAAAPLRSVSPPIVGDQDPVGGPAVVSERKKVNPLRQDVSDFKAFLTTAAAASPPRGGRYDEDDNGFDDITMDEEMGKAPEATPLEDTEQVVDSTAVTKGPKLDLGFDDSTSSSDDEGISSAVARRRPRPAEVNHGAAIAAMGVSQEAAARIGVGKSHIHTDPILESIPEALDDAPVDVSENAMARLRAGRPTTSTNRNATSGDLSSASPARLPPCDSDNAVDSNELSPRGRQETSPPYSPHSHHSASDDDERSPKGKASNSASSSMARPFDDADGLALSMVSDRTIIFLDVDGVLVPVSPMSFGGGEIDHLCVKHLKSIVDLCGGLVTVVLTSTWRNDDAKKVRLNAAFEAAGIPLVTLGVPNGVPEPSEVSYLPDDLQEQGLIRDRVDEIFLFMDTNVSMFPEAFRGGRWLAIDDMNLGLDPRMAGHFLLTDTEEGLTAANVAHASAITMNFKHFSPSASTAERKAEVNEALRQGGTSFCSSEDLLLPLGIEPTADIMVSSIRSYENVSRTSMLTDVSSDEELRMVSISSMDEIEKKRVIAVVKDVQALRKRRLELVEAMGDVHSRVARALEKLKASKGASPQR